MTTLRDAAARVPASRRGRRRLLAAGTLPVLAALLGGCGFALRRTPDLRFGTIQLAGFRADSPLGDDLRRAIDATPGTRVVPASARPQVVLQALTDAREKGVVATTAAALVREVQLRSRFSYVLRTPDGDDLAPQVDLLLRRDMSYNEADALAKEEEEDFLYRAMQADIVAQVMRRLAALPVAGAPRQP